MAPLFRRRLRPLDDGHVAVRLSDDERALLGHLADQMDALLADPDDPALQRLFPPAFTDDPVEEAGYQMLMGDELLQSHVRSVRLLRDLADEHQLDPSQANAWLQAINATFVYLGARLDITEDSHRVRVDPDDPDIALWLTFEFLGEMLSELVHVLTTQLPDEAPTNGPP